MVPYLENFKLLDWAEASRESWGTRGIKMVWESPGYITFVGRGPTRGKEFHIGPGDEIFYQLMGELHFHYMVSERERKVMVVRPGELFLLPAKVPHAPRRPDDSSLTLVVERQRHPEDMDRWVWFCERCNNKLYEAGPKFGEGPSNAPNQTVINANNVLRANEQLRTCTQCGEVFPAPG